ncbi:UDP-N-acetylglucosamine 2-epimerase [Thermaerobacter sp. PB12/4term]|uniref:UDP-N-acetylglucosamine 2-epimerase n=1 Tax=Thermaerobacter sp. PB12/4term TaxID=2293838 RepID=UPI00210F457A|nr:UDP-N-acetylglucosamine 2-epimerase [Thermaerobacter sp. PB12/4term]
MYVSGTRADYGLMRTTLRALAAQPGWQVSVVAVGMHLSPYHGKTVDLIRSDGFDVVAAIPTLVESDSGFAYAASVGLTTIAIGRELERLQPDLVILLGDRGEMLAAALAASAQNMVIAHVNGGDRTHSIDEPIRHAITQFAHLHFVATEEAAAVVRRLGAPGQYIFVVGAPGVDEAQEVAGSVSKDAARRMLELKSESIVAVVAYHPTTTETNVGTAHLRDILVTLRDLGAYTITLLPNADPGYSCLRQTVEQYAWPGMKIVSHIERSRFLLLMRAADVMVGNTSAGIIEAPTLGLPFVHVGSRQLGRIRGANVIDVPNVNRENLRQAIIHAVSSQFRKVVERSRNPYGDGQTGIRIARILAGLELCDIPRQRQFEW